MTGEREIIFISCGQRTSEEIELGGQIQELVRELTPFEPYFAENQTSLEGLTKNIFSALYNAVGFITVMHPRGVVRTDNEHTRASVWVEQEIAIAAFIRETLGKHINVAAYAHEDIKLEGVRENLLLNPKIFTGHNEVLDNLRLVLPDWRVPNTPTESIDLSIEYEKVKLTSEKHDYKLLILATNRGSARVDGYYADVEVPRVVMYDRTYNYYVENRCTDTHLFFRVQPSDPIYPGDTVRLVAFDYYVDNEMMQHPEILTSPVRATLYLDDMPPIITEKPLAQLQIF